jgi:methyl-accepting chemotaxis protein
MVNLVKSLVFNTPLKIKLLVIFMGMIMVPLIIFSSWVNFTIQAEFRELSAVTAAHEQTAKAGGSNIASVIEGHIEGQQEFLNLFQKRLLTNTILILVWSLFLSVVIGLFFTRFLTKPMHDLLAAMQQVEKGDFTVRVNNPFKDELGQVSDGFNRSINQTVFLIKQVKASAHQVSSASQELAAGAQESGRVSEQISEAIQTVAQGAEQQANNVRKNAVVLNDMSQSIKKIADNTNEATGTSEKMIATAQSGGTAIQLTAQKMYEIEKVVEESTQVVTLLGKRSQEIGRIIDLIKSIADQTNLLALNAAIEAARAGEQGRGFAVVAEEVRKLAEGSAAATEDIARIIGEIQGETERAVNISAKGTKVANEGSRLAEETKLALQEILNAIESTNSKIAQIAGASQQLSAGSIKVMESMDDVSRVAEDTSASSQQVAAASEEQNASVQEVAASAHQLSEIAKGLEQLVEKFKVD